jgi:hypothetical protein
MYEEWVSWESLSKIEVPKIRVYTKKSQEKEESIRNAIRKNPEVFFHRSPLVVTRSAESGRLFLGDGADRLKIAMEEKVPKVMLSIEEYETDSEAYEAAQDDSYRMNEDRGDVVTYSVVELIRERYQKGMTVKEIAEKYDKSESYIYNILAVASDKELMELLREEKITLHEAVKAAYNPELKKGLIEKFIKTPMTVIEETKKPRIEEISAREERIEEIEARWKPLEEISRKEPRFEEIYERAVREAEAELRRKISGTIKYSVKRIAEDLNMRDEEDIRTLLEKAEEILGGEKSDVQQKVLWAWKREAEEEEIGRKWGWGPFTLKEALSRILREVKKGEYAGAKPTVSTYRSVSEARPRAEEKAKKVARELLEPKHKVEEAVEVKPAEASLEEEFRKLDSKLIEGAKKEAIFVLWASFGDPSVSSPKELWYVVNDERLYDMYREAGELGTRMVFEKSIENIRKILVGRRGGKDWLTLYKAFDDPKVRDEAVKVILETYRECRDEIIMMRDKLRGEVWDALVRTLRNATPFPIGDGRALILTDTLDVIIAKRRENEGYIRIEGKDGRIIGYKRLSEVLATLTEENTRIVRSYEMPLPRKVKRLVISPKSFPGVEDPGKIEIVVLQCSNCGEIMRDGLTDLPHVCGECNSPAKEHRLYEGKPR